MAGNEGGGGGGTNVDPKAAAEVAKSMQAVKQAAADAARAFGEQLQAIAQLQAAMASMAQSMGAMGAASEKAFSPDKWKQVTKEAAAQEKQVGKTETAIQKISKAMQGPLAKAAIIGSSALTGLGQGFKNLFALMKGGIGLFGSVAGGAFSVAKSVAAIPFKMLKGLTDMAQSGGGGNELAAAYEEVRKEFGAFSSVSSSTIIGVTKNMAGFNDTGLSSIRVFGNTAERMKHVLELAKGMGPQFAKNAEEFNKNGGALLAYQKGLGLTAEQMGVVALKGQQMGTSMSKVLNDMTKQATHMAKAFGLDAKVISKDMGKAMADVKNFGHLSTKELASAVVYANKLGVSIDKLTGLMDAFDTFDQAAESTSKLNEQFGTNIDAQEIMSAQSPAEKMELLRKEFAKTGKDMSQLSYQERKLIQQTTGLDAATMDAMLAQKDQGDMLSDINKESQKAEDKTLSQADAMKELANSIERLTPSGGGGGGGFLDHILGGFKKGIQSAPEFIKLMSNIRVSLMHATQFGVKMGRAFVDMFPGVKQIFGGLADMFSPQKFKKMFDGILKIVDDFKKGNIKSMDELMKKLQDVFFGFFDSQKESGKKVLDGFKKFGTAIVQIMSKLLIFAVNKLAEVIPKITEFIKNPKIGNVKGGGEWAKILDPLWEALKLAKDKLGPVLKDLAVALFVKMKDALIGTTTGKVMLGAALVTVLGPAVMNAFAGAGAAGIFKSAGKLFGKGLGGALGQGAQKEGVAAAGAGLANAAQDLGAKLVSGPGAMIAATLPDKETIEKMQTAGKANIDWMALTKFVLGMAALFTIGLAAFSVALAIVKNAKPADLGKAALVLLALTPIMMGMGKVVESLANVSNVNMGDMAKLMLAMAGFMLIGLGAFYVALKVVSGVSMGDIGKATVAMFATLAVMAATALLLPEAVVVGELAKKKGAAMAIGMIAMGLAVIAIAGVDYIIAKMLGNVPVSQLLKAIPAVLATTLVFAAAGLILIEAAVIGLIAQSTGPAILIGMVAMALAVIAIGATAWVLAEILGEVPASALLKAVMTVNALIPAFIASGLLLVEAAAVGAIILSGIGAAAMVLGMAAMALALIAVAETAIILTDMIAPLNVGALVKAGMTMTIMLPAFTAAGVLLLAAGALGAVIIATLGVGAAAMAIGMKAVQKGLMFIAETAVLLVEQLGGLPLGPLAQTAGIMVLMSAAFVATGALILAAGAIGAAIIASLGVGAKAIEIGMKTIADAMGMLSGAAIGILEALSQIKSDPAELKAKAEAFNAVLGGISSLMSTVATVVGAMPFSLFDSAEDTAAKMGEVTKFMDSLIGKPGAPGGITGLLEKITAGLTSVPPDRVESAKAIGGILSAIGNLVGSLAGPALKLVEDSSSWFQSKAEDAAKAKTALDNAQGFITGVMTAAGTLITTITEALTKLSSSEQSSLEKGGTAIAGILGAIGKFMEAVKPPKIEIKDANIDGFGNSINVTMPSIGGMLDAMKDKIPAIITSLVAAVASVPQDKGFIDKVNVVKNLFEFIGKMMDVIKFMKELKPEKPDMSVVDAMLAPINDMTGFFEKLAQEKISTLVTSILAVGDAIGPPAKLKKVGIVSKAIGELLSGVSATMKSLAEINKGEAGTFDAANMVKAVETLGSAMGQLKEPIVNVTKKLEEIGAAVPKKSIEAATGASKSMADLLKAVGDISKAVSDAASPATTLKDNAGKLDTTPKDLGTVGTSAEAAGKAFEGFKIAGVKQATAAVKAVEDMVKAVQGMDDALSKVPKVDITTRLAKFAGQMGIGSTGVYTVQSKEVVVTVNLSVKMDAGELERVLIENSKSIIRDRVNFLLSGGAEKDNAEGAKIQSSYGASSPAPTQV